MESKYEKVKLNATYDVVAKGMLKGRYGKEIACKMINDVYPELNILPSQITEIDTVISGAANVKTHELDVLLAFKDIFFDIEIQRTKPKYSFRYRMVSYASRILADRNKKGDDYKENKVVLIAVCDYDEFNNGKFLTTFQFKDEEKYNGINLDYIKLSFIQLPFLDKCDKMMMKTFYEMMKSDYPDEYRGKDEVIDMAIDEIKRINNEVGIAEILARIEEDKKIQRTLEKQLIERGLEEGKAQEKRVIAKSLKEAKIAIDVIVNSTGLTKEEIEEL